MIQIGWLKIGALTHAIFGRKSEAVACSGTSWCIDTPCWLGHSQLQKWGILPGRLLITMRQLQFNNKLVHIMSTTPSLQKKSASGKKTLQSSKASIVHILTMDFMIRLTQKLHKLQTHTTHYFVEALALTKMIIRMVFLEFCMEDMKEILIMVGIHGFYHMVLQHQPFTEGLLTVLPILEGSSLILKL